MPGARSGGSRPRPRSGNWRGSRNSSPTRSPPPRRQRRPIRAVAAVSPRLSAAADDGAPGPRGVRDASARGRAARERGRGPPRFGALRGQDAPHDALRDAHPGADPGRGGTRIRRGPRRDGPAGPRPVADLVPRPADRPTTTARSSAVCSTPSRQSTRRPTTCSTSVARRTPGSRRSARERDLIGLADEPLEIQWTPVFLRAFGGAMLSSPGPLDKGQKAFFAITPMPDDWTDEQRESNLREDNDRMLRLLTIHEAVPGHYLQGVYANRCPSLVRADLRERAVRRGLGRLRDPGDDGRRLRRGRSGAAPDALEVLPARDHQRDHRRADPLSTG